MQMKLDLANYSIPTTRTVRRPRRVMPRSVNGWIQLILPFRVSLISKPNRRFVVSLTPTRQIIVPTLSSAAMIVVKHLSKRFLSRAKMTLSNLFNLSVSFRSSTKDS